MHWILILKMVVGGQLTYEERSFPTKATCDWLAEQLVEIQVTDFAITYTCVKRNNTSMGGG